MYVLLLLFVLYSLKQAFDEALNPIGLFLPNLPLPAFKRRDAARLEMVKTFTEVIERRRRTGERVCKKIHFIILISLE